MPELFTNITAGPVPLASGQILAPGDRAEISKDPHDQALVTDGSLARSENETDYQGLKHDQLTGLADAAGLDVKGTGRDGSVTNADLTRALKANDKKEGQG